MEKAKNVLHLAAGGGIGGIETLLKNYSRLTIHHNIYIFVWAGGLNADEIRKNGNEVEIIGEENAGIISTIWYIVQICRKKSIDAIVVHNASPLLRLIGFLARHISNVKIVQYAHSDAKSMFVRKSQIKSYIVKFINKIAFNDADCVVAISDFVRTSLVTELGILESKICVVYNGVPIDNYDFNESISKKNSLIYVGRLIEEKGVQIIIKALKQMSKSICLEIVGDGPYRDELEKLVERLNLNDKVTFFGNQNNVIRFLKDSSIFISVPTLEEGLGLSVIEAMAAGLICVCSKSGGLVELIENRYNGFIINKNDELELAAILDSILENTNTEKIKQIINNAKKSSRVYSLKSYAHNLDQIILNITDKTS